MNLAAHQAAVTPAPTCPGCGRPMAPTPAGHYTCDHTDATPTPYGLPRGDDTAVPNHAPRLSSAPWPTRPDHGPTVLHTEGPPRRRGRR